MRNKIFIFLLPLSTAFFSNLQDDALSFNVRLGSAENLLRQLSDRISILESRLSRTSSQPTKTRTIYRQAPQMAYSSAYYRPTTTSQAAQRPSSGQKVSQASSGQQQPTRNAAASRIQNAYRMSKAGNLASGSGSSSGVFTQGSTSSSQRAAVQAANAFQRAGARREPESR